MHNRINLNEYRDILIENHKYKNKPRKRLAVDNWRERGIPLLLKGSELPVLKIAQTGPLEVVLLETEKIEGKIAKLKPKLVAL